MISTIASQLAEITMTSEDGNHLILIDKVDIVLDTKEVVSAIAASAYLSVKEWGTTYPCSAHTDCILWSHVSDPAATVVAPVVTEDEEDTLVRKASRPSLASLYKRARQTGLVPASTQGYF